MNNGGNRYNSMPGGQSQAWPPHIAWPEQEKEKKNTEKPYGDKTIYFTGCLIVVVFADKCTRAAAADTTRETWRYNSVA